MWSVFYLVLAVVIGLALGVVGMLYHGSLATPDAPMPVEVEKPAPEPQLLPPSLDELQIILSVSGWTCRSCWIGNAENEPYLFISGSRWTGVMWCCIHR